MFCRRDSYRPLFRRISLFLRLGEKTISLVPFTLVSARDGQPASVPSPLVAQKLRLARQLSNLVVVYVHWGAELFDWPQPSQYEQAKWLVRNGADLIIGHHPHVIQKPECVSGKPVFFSLGNHLFDQKYPETKKGLIADCEFLGDRAESKVVCGGIETQAALNSSFPARVSPPAEEISSALDSIHIVESGHETIQVLDYRLRPHLGDREWMGGDFCWKEKARGFRTGVSQPVDSLKSSPLDLPTNHFYLRSSNTLHG